MITLIAEAAARSLVLGLAVWLVLLLVRPRNPHVHKTVWVSVLLATLTMPLMMRMPFAATISLPDAIVTLGVGSTMPLTLTGDRWPSFGAIYLLIAAALAGRFSIGLITMWRIRRQAPSLHEPWTEGLDVRVSERLTSPVTFASTILLPVQYLQWRANERAAVIAHERSHVRQYDCYVVWLARLNTCIFWFNPLAWWLARRISLLAETTSDDAVLEVLSDRSAYAELLLDFARREPPARIGLAMAHSNIPERIERIISGINPSGALRMSQRLLLVALLVPLIALATVPLQSAAIAAGQSDSAEEPRIIDWGDLAEQEKYYPPQAAQAGIEGLVSIAVTLDRQGRATDTLILSEDPLDMGFGAAASALAHTMTYSNPTGQQTQLPFRIKFALDED